MAVESAPGPAARLLLYLFAAASAAPLTDVKSGEEIPAPVRSPTPSRAAPSAALSRPPSAPRSQMVGSF